MDHTVAPARRPFCTPAPSGARSSSPGWSTCRAAGCSTSSKGRAGRAVSDWLQVRDEAWLSTVQRVALDPYRGYDNALVGGGLDALEVVVDAFHAVGFGNVMVDDVRRLVQQDTLGHRGRKGDPLYGIRRLLLTDHGRDRIRDGLRDADRDDEVWYAWCVKQLLRGVYRAGNETAARDALTELYDTAAADIPECDRLARTIRRWENEILAYYRNDGLSNARTRGRRRPGQEGETDRPQVPRHQQLPDPDSVDLIDGVLRDVRSFGHFGTGDLEVRITADEHVEIAKEMIARSYAIS